MRPGGAPQAARPAARCHATGSVGVAKASQRLLCSLVCFVSHTFVSNRQRRAQELESILIETLCRLDGHQVADAGVGGQLCAFDVRSHILAIRVWDKRVAIAMNDERG